MSPGIAGPRSPGNGRSPASLAEIHELSAVELRDALRSGRAVRRQATDHFLDRIEAENPHLGAFITVTAEQARKDAAAADRAPRPPEPRTAAPCPLLHGMPVAFKDLTDVAGVVTTHGSAALERKPALADGALPAALKAAGVVSLGKTQVPEFGLTAYSENRIAPPSRNPYALSRSSGGSSRRQRCRGGRGAVAVRPRVRRRRLRADPGRGVRAGGAEARTWAGAGRGKLRRSRAARGCRTAGPLRRRRRAAARCPGAGPGQSGCGRTGCGRSGHGRPGARQLPRTDRQGAPPAADRHKPRQPVANEVSLHPGP